MSLMKWFGLSTLVLVLSSSTMAAGDAALVGKVLAPGAPNADLTQVTVTLEGTGQSTGVDPRGRFRFEGLEPGVYAVHAILTGPPALYARVEGIRIAPNQTYNAAVLLLREAGTLSGYAYLDDANDHSGIHVGIPGTRFLTRTGPDGSWFFANVPAGVHTLYAMKAGYETVRLGGVEVESGLHTDAPELVLSPLGPPAERGSLAGAVYGMSAAGPSALAGAEVRLARSNANGHLADCQGVTDDDGQYGFDNLPAGAYMLMVDAAGYLSARVPVLIAPQAAVTEDVYLVPDVPAGSGHVVGHVTKDTGPLNLWEPLEGVGVWARVNGVLVSTQTDRRGYYDLHPVPQGKVMVHAEKTGHGSKSVVVDVPDTGVAVANFQLETQSLAPGCIFGQVFGIDSTGFMLPLPGAEVSLYPPEAVPLDPNTVLPPSPWRTNTGPTGRFQILDVPAGDYVGVATKPGYLNGLIPVIIPPDMCVEKVFRLNPAPVVQVGRVEGAVSEDTGMLDLWIPIADALVELAPENGPVLSVLTDDLGQFAFPSVPVGVWPMEVSASGYESATGTVQVEAGGTTRIQFQLKWSEEEYGSIAGNVSGASGGASEPIADATLVLMPLHDVFPAGSAAGHDYLVNHPVANDELRKYATTDADGNYRFADLPAGPYVLGVQVRGWDPQRKRAVVEADEETIVDFVLQPKQFGAVAGEVVEATDAENPGEPIPGAWVALIPQRDDGVAGSAFPVLDELAPDGVDGLAADLASAMLEDLSIGTHFRRTTTAADGSYEFPMVPTGPWQVVAAARGFLRQSRETVVEPNETSIVDFALSPAPKPGAGSVEGVVQEDTGMLPVFIPIAGAVVTLHPAGPHGAPFLDDADDSTKPVISLNFGQERPNAGSAAQGLRPAHFLSTKTDDDGFYRFEDVPEGRWIIRVRAQDYQPETARLFVGAGEDVVKHFSLKPIPKRFGALTGTVVENDAGPGNNGKPGDPIQGAWVIAFPRQYADRILNGDFGINDPVIPEESVNTRNGKSQRPGERPGQGPKDPRDLIKDLRGFPGIPNMSRWHDFTDADGRYVIDPLPAGEYMVVCLARDYRPARKLVGVPVGVTVVADFALNPRPDPLPGLVGGRVTAINTNTSETAAARPDRVIPVAGAIVSLIPVDELDRLDKSSGVPGGNGAVLPSVQRLFAITGPNGDYLIPGVPEGRYVAVAEAQGYGPQRQRIGVESGERTMANFLLEPLSAGSVLGAVTSSKTGQPIPNAMLVLAPAGGGNQLPAVQFSDSDGNYAFPRVRPGRYLLAAVAKQYKPDAQTIQVVAGAETLADFELDPVRNNNAGQVYGGVFEDSASETPLADALVSLIPGGAHDGILPPPGLQTRTDKQGRYRFPAVAAGAFVIRAEKAGYTSDEAAIRVDAGDEVQVDFYLAPGSGLPDTGDLAGRVTDRGDGKPIRGAHILAYPDSNIPLDGGIFPPVPLFEAWTDGDGDYLIPGLNPGEYVVRCEARGYGSAETRVRVHAGRITTANFSLAATGPVTQKVFGKVTAYSPFPTFVPIPIPGAVVELTLADSGGTRPVVYQAVADRNGDYEFPDVAPGDYEAVASATGYTDLKQRVTVNAGVDRRVDFELHEAVKGGATVTGQVFGASANDLGLPFPLEGATLTLRPKWGIFDVPVPGLLTATTDADGNYAFPNVPADVPSQWILTCEMKGYESAEMELTLADGDAVTQDFVLNRSGLLTPDLIKALSALGYIG